MALKYLTSMSFYVPELLVCLTMLLLIFVESTYGNNETKGKKAFNGVAYLGLTVTAIILFMNMGDKPVTIFTNAVVIDPFSTLMKIIMVIGTLGAIYLSNQSSDIYDELKSEFTIMATGVLVGGMLLSSANNMLILYIAVETLSILSYVLASFKKNDERSSEAGLKYSLYGGISAGVMLFGMSHIFGVTGSIDFAVIATKMTTLSSGEMWIMMPSFLLFFVGLGYKIACVPFHMWSPDVYEGSPLPVTAFFAIVPKMAGLAAIIRVSMLFFSGNETLSTTWFGVLSIVAVLTMTVGNISAIGQRSIKRMLAFSSISHAGMMLMGVLVLNDAGIRSVLFYGITYLFMTLVAFYITSFIQDKYGNDHFERFNGLIYRYPIMAVMMAMTMFSLAGVPPFSGFVAKFNIFSVLLEKQEFSLAVIAGLNSVVALYYYLKIVKLMVFKPVESEETISGFGYLNQGIIVVLSIPVLLLGIYWSKIIHLADVARIYIP